MSKKILMLLTLFYMEPGFTLEEIEECEHLKVRKTPCETYDKFTLHQVLPTILDPWSLGALKTYGQMVTHSFSWTPLINDHFHTILSGDLEAYNTKTVLNYNLVQYTYLSNGENIVLLFILKEQDEK